MPCRTWRTSPCGVEQGKGSVESVLFWRAGAACSAWRLGVHWPVTWRAAAAAAQLAPASAIGIGHFLVLNYPPAGWRVRMCTLRLLLRPPACLSLWHLIVAGPACWAPKPISLLGVGGIPLRPHRPAADSWRAGMFVHHPTSTERAASDMQRPSTLSCHAFDRVLCVALSAPTLAHLGPCFSPRPATPVTPHWHSSSSSSCSTPQPRSAAAAASNRMPVLAVGAGLLSSDDSPATCRDPHHDPH